MNFIHPHTSIHPYIHTPTHPYIHTSIHIQIRQYNNKVTITFTRNANIIIKIYNNFHTKYQYNIIKI